MSPKAGIANRLEEVRGIIESTAVAGGRDPAEITIVAVSKEVPPAAILEAAEAGQRDFGENRAQELVSKHAQLEGGGLRWHFVGRLQRNKVRQIVGLVQVIHSLDRIELAGEIGRRAERPVEVLIEVNTSGEPAKGGVTPGGLHALIEKAGAIEGLRLTGLMTMAPLVSGSEDARPFFARLAQLREEARRRFPLLGIHHLSMGMSQDYPVAVEEGATILRVGEAIFGPRSGR